VNDGWGAPVSIKGRSFQGAVLFADISGFSRHTKDLTPTETLVFVNTFFSWMSAEGLRATHGIIDKYIGDEMMVVFAREFGSKDPVNDAVNSARWMIENDVLEYRPRIGIAYGDMIAGYVGTPLSFNASVFGQPVTLAARCCSTQRLMNGSGGIVMPASTWAGRTIETVMPPVLSDHPDQGQVALPIDWTVGGRRSADLKNIGEVEILELCHL
jgi:class 3 adenylate cyclase